MAIRKSIYDYTFEECKKLTMKSTTGYSWYDVAMYDICANFDKVLKEHSLLENEPIHKNMVEFNNFIAKHAYSKKGYFTKQELYQFLSMLTTIQLQEIESKYQKNPWVWTELFEEFKKYQKCMSEYLNLNELESLNLELSAERELVKMRKLNNLIDAVCEVQITTNYNKQNVGNMHAKYLAAVEEYKQIGLPPELSERVHRYLCKVEAYLDFMIKKVNTGKR